MKPIATLMILLLAVAPANAGRLDDKLTASDPCQDLPQINQTEAVTLERATLEVLPETAEMTLSGRIACRSPADAMLESDASVRVEALVSLRIEDCTATRSEVTLSDVDGSVGGLIEAFASALEDSLAEDLARSTEEECRENFD